MRLHTPLTRLLGIDLPLLVSGPNAPAASEAGALGLIEAGPDLATQVDEFRAATTRPFAIALPPGAPEAVIAAALAARPAIIATTNDPNHHRTRIKATGLYQLHTAPLDPIPFESLARALAGLDPAIPLVATHITSGATLAAALSLGAAGARVPPSCNLHQIVQDYAAAIRALPVPTAPLPRNPDRTAREAASLRENLRRRKDQVRARTTGS